LSEAATTNRTLVSRFLGLVLEGRADAALELVSEDHVEHSATIEAGRAGLAKFLGAVAANRDATLVSVERMIADDRHVVVHLHTRWLKEDRSTAAIDIFRIDDDRIVEHWDVVQEVPTDPVNPTSMF